MIASRAASRARRQYRRAAPRYGFYRRLWLDLAGEAAEQALLADLAGTLRPGMRVLDAGCGTGAISREILRLCPGVRLAMLDLCPAMLAEAAGTGAPRVIGDAVQLPFADGAFDVVVSAWAIETMADPKRAVAGYLRVLARRGRVFCTFCSRPPGWTARLRSLPLRCVVRAGFAGRFLTPARTPFHDCRMARRRRFHDGLVTGIALAKCCTVGNPPGPCLRNGNLR